MTKPVVVEKIDSNRPDYENSEQNPYAPSQENQNQNGLGSIIVSHYEGSEFRSDMPNHC